MTPDADFLNTWACILERASWQAGIVVLAVWCVCRIAPALPARLQSWLWRIALLKFLAILIWTAPIAVPLLPAPELTTFSSAAPVSPMTISAAGEGTLAEPSQRLISPWLIPFLVWIALVLWQAVRLRGAFRAARSLRSKCQPSTDASLVE